MEYSELVSELYLVLNPSHVLDLDTHLPTYELQLRRVLMADSVQLTCRTKYIYHGDKQPDSFCLHVLYIRSQFIIGCMEWSGFVF